MRRAAAKLGLQDSKWQLSLSSKMQGQLCPALANAERASLAEMQVDQASNDSPERLSSASMPQMTGALAPAQSTSRACLPNEKALAVKSPPQRCRNALQCRPTALFAGLLPRPKAGAQSRRVAKQRGIIAAAHARQRPRSRQCLRQLPTHGARLRSPPVM